MEQVNYKSQKGLLLWKKQVAKQFFFLFFFQIRTNVFLWTHHDAAITAKIVFQQNSKADLLYSALCGIFPNHTELNLWGEMGPWTVREDWGKELGRDFAHSRAWINHHLHWSYGVRLCIHCVNLHNTSIRFSHNPPFCLTSSTTPTLSPTLQSFVPWNWTSCLLWAT